MVCSPLSIVNIVLTSNPLCEPIVARGGGARCCPSNPITPKEADK